MARQTKKIIGPVTRAMAEDAFADYNTKVSALTIIEGEMNGEITAVKERFESRINKLQDARDESFDIMQSYAMDHPELFEKRKSVDWTHGTFGFRTGMPKIKTRKGFTWASVLTLVKGLFPTYVRNVEELNKDLIIADREKLGEGKLKDMGVEVVQDETFFIAPKLEEIATA
jgi:phage host-nuclease inhibitor protein Gam